MKKHLPTVILILVFLAGLSLLLYPTVSDWWNSMHQSQAVSDYSQTVSNMNDETYKKLLNEAVKYNEKLTESGGGVFVLTDKELEEYNSLLKIDATGIMGYIEIPVLQTELPIYHGTSDAALATGVGHIEGSSLPVGGKGTHCVLSGHRGLPSAKLLSNLDRMVEGDAFILHVLDETLTYEVDQIRIVEPEDTSDLLIEEDKDYCTLVTCTPYGINSHRLLVRGHRIANAQDNSDVRVTSDAMQIEPLLVAVFVAIPMLLILLAVLLIRTRKRSSEKTRKDEQV